MVDEVTEL